jgi:hypothetical protein
MSALKSLQIYEKHLLGNAIASKSFLHRNQTTSENAAALKSLSNVEESIFEKKKKTKNYFKCI